MNAAEERNIIPIPMNDPAKSQDVSQATAPEAAGAGNLEKVRDILFGAQMRDYDRRFDRLEEQMLKDISESREDARRRFDQLENFIKQEIAALNERLMTENQQRMQSGEDLTREVRDTARSIREKINQLDEQASQSSRELRQQILDQSKNLSDEIRQKYDDLAATISRESRELRFNKTDRVALSNLFTELALRLNNEFKLPGEE
jgi:hypothetical protein